MYDVSVFFGQDNNLSNASDCLLFSDELPLHLDPFLSIFDDIFFCKKLLC